METPFQKFKALQAELHSLLKEQSFDEQLVQKKMTKYIALMVEDSPEQQERMFDHFCEFGGVELLGRVMRGDPLLAVKCYSLLFINLRNEMWISYILCQSFLMEAISLRAPSADEEYTEYFVSFLKSLSIRINQSQVTLFYNKRNCTFPLAMAAMHYHNHPDFMVRTSVMNIILELMKIRETKTQLYFSRFPFTSYLVAFACEVSQLVRSFDAKLGDPALQAKQLSSYKVDLSDYLYYFNDLVQFATATTVRVIEHIVIAYIIVPTFWRLLREERRERLHALIVIHECLRVIKSRPLLDIITLFLLKPQLSLKALSRIRQFEGVLEPEEFKKQFNPASSYWGDYEQEVVGHCLEIFKDVEKFQVSYEDTKHEVNAKFEEEVGRISHYIGYDLLRNGAIGERIEQQLEDSADTVVNPFKVTLLQFLSPALPQEYTLATSILLNLTHNTNISLKVLEVCELRLLREYPVEVDLEESSRNKASFTSPMISNLKSTLINSIKEIEWEETRVATLKNSLRLLEMLVVESEEIEFEEELLKNYREITGRLRQHVKLENMELIVDNFALLHKQMKEAQNSNPTELSIPYPPLFLPQERWDEHYHTYSLPLKQNQRILHLIQHFFLFRSFVTAYFHKFYEAEYPSFDQEYNATFNQTANRWKKGEFYRITGRTLNLCLLDCPERRKKAMIIEDQFSFVLGELFEKSGCKILVNESWKKVGVQISKEEGTWVQVSVGENKTSERYRLIFEDQVRSGATLVRMNDIRWEYMQFELSFISKFLKVAAEE